MDPLSAFAAITETATTTHSTIPTTRDEAMVYWARALKETTGNTLKLEKTRITSAAAIQALYEVLPQYSRIQKLDFTLCTFSDEAFKALMTPPESPYYKLELAWIPTEQIFLIEAQKVAKFKKLTIHPPKEPLEAIEIDLFIDCVKTIYSGIMGRFHLNLAPCHFSKAQTRPLEDLVSKGLQLEPITSTLVLPGWMPTLIQTQEETPPLETYEILQDQKANREECAANWRKLFGILKEGATALALNDSDYSVFSQAPNPILTFFEEIQKTRHQVDTFDLCEIVFTEETWVALLQSLNDYKPKIKKLTFNSISLDQLESFFTKLSNETLQSLEELDLSQSSYLRVSPQDRDRLSAILSKHLPRMKLQSLRLDNWLLEDKHLSFATTGTEIYINNHRVKNNSNPKVHLIANETESSNTTALFANSEIDEATLETLWEITLPESTPPFVALGDLKGPDLFIDSPTSILTLFNALQKNTNYKDFFFFRLEFSEQAWAILLENLKKTPSITIIGFSRCHLSPDRIAQLSSIPHLQDLSICSNGELTNKVDFFRSLHQVISHSPNLRTLDLAYNHLTDIDLPSIFSFDIRGKLASLILKGNCITDEGLNYLNAWNNIRLSGQKRSSNGETAATPCKINLKQNPILSLVPSDVDPAEETFEKKLRTFFKIKDVSHDGNCLFHACALEVTASHQELRARAVLHMRANEFFFALHMENNKSLQAYTNDMAKDKTWGGNVEIAALSQSLNVPIAVYCKEHETTERGGKLFPPDLCLFGAEEGTSIFDNPRTIFLYRCNEEHYQRLYPKQA